MFVCLYALMSYALRPRAQHTFAAQRWFYFQDQWGVWGDRVALEWVHRAPARRKAFQSGFGCRYIGVVAIRQVRNATYSQAAPRCSTFSCGGTGKQFAQRATGYTFATVQAYRACFACVGGRSLWDSQSSAKAMWRVCRNSAVWQKRVTQRLCGIRNCSIFLAK